MCCKLGKRLSIHGVCTYLCHMKTIFRPFFLLLLPVLSLLSCTTVDLYEKTVFIPGHEWESSYKPEFSFTIKDTTALYQVLFVIRHTEKYNYRNIWINLYSQPPGDTLHKAMYELPLANNEGWFGSGMDDIYEHRVRLTNGIPLRAGEYKLMVENIMREDPLKHVLNVGIRIEKVK